MPAEVWSSRDIPQEYSLVASQETVNKLKLPPFQEMVVPGGKSESTEKAADR